MEISNGHQYQAISSPPYHLHQEINTSTQSQSQQTVKCPRCDSINTKFCYYNNYSLSQPRYLCKSCKRYWTKGGSLRNIPIGGGCRKNKKSSSSMKLTLDQDCPNPNPNPNPRLGNIKKSGFVGSTNTTTSNIQSYYYEVGGDDSTPIATNASATTVSHGSYWSGFINGSFNEIHDDDV